MQFSLIRIYFCLAVLAVTALAGCGGGSAKSTVATAAANATHTTVNANSSTATSTATSSASTPTLPTITNFASAQYASGSAQGAMFNQINSYRQACGFPLLQENAMLDTAAQNHVQYMVRNAGFVTDSEIVGNPGFTGVTGQTRAEYAGWPAAIGVGTGSASYYTNQMLTMAQYGQAMVNSWASGVYHQYAIIGPLSSVGLGVLPNNVFNYVGTIGSIEMGQLTNIASANATPLTFPCQGVTGIFYGGMNESPSPPNASGTMFGYSAWGTPIAVMGNPSDSIVLLTATVSAAGTTSPVAVQILNSSGNPNADPNAALAAYQAVAYPTSPLNPYTTYNVNLTGTVNGTPFTRAFSFTTGDFSG